MPTNYRIGFMATHPLSMTFNPPKANVILGAIEDLLGANWGMTPVSASVERADNETTFTEHEGKSWVHNAPDDLILSVAKMLDGFIAQAMDPDSDVESYEAVHVAGAGSTAIAEAFLEYRKAAKGS